MTIEVTIDFSPEPTVTDRTPMPMGKILTAAQIVIHDKGWRQGLGDGSAPRCVGEAISDTVRAFYGATVLTSEVQRVCRLFADANHLPSHGIHAAHSSRVVSFNDEQGRTLDEINTAFSRAITFAAQHSDEY